MRIAVLFVSMLLGIGAILFALFGLGSGIWSMIADGTIQILLPMDGVTSWPLSGLAVLLFALKMVFVICLGLGLVAMGLFVGLNSDVMYLPAMAGLVLGLVGNVAIDLLVKAFLFEG